MKSAIQWELFRSLQASVKTTWGRFHIDLMHTEKPGWPWRIEVEALGRGFVTLVKRDTQADTMRKAKAAAIALMAEMDEQAAKLSELREGNARAQAEILGARR